MGSLEPQPIRRNWSGYCWDNPVLCVRRWNVLLLEFTEMCVHTEMFDWRLCLTLPILRLPDLDFSLLGLDLPGCLVISAGEATIISWSALMVWNASEFDHT